MSKILVNYNYNKKKDEYKLLENDYVFADLPVAVLETNTDYNEILVVSINNTPTVVERSEYEAKNKKFKLAIDENGKVVENENGAEVWLPIDTNLDELSYVNGQLVKAEKEKPKEEEIE